MEQMTLLLLSPYEWLLDDNQMYVLLDLIHTLDFSEARDPRGREKGFDSRIISMTVLLLYAYCVGIVSSRKIERAYTRTWPFRCRRPTSSQTTAGSVGSDAATSMHSRYCLFRFSASA
jgi:hypothetical protein